MNIELPKRDDSIYKEIESFEYYEFTNCIAFEMAIRNTKVKKLLSKTKLFSEVRNTTKEEPLECVHSYIDSIISKEHKENRKDVIFELSKYGFDYHSCFMYTLQKSMSKIKNHNYSSILLDKSEYTKITDILTKNELDIVCKVEINLYNQMPWVKTEKDKLKTNEDFLEMGNHFEWIFHPTNEELIKDALKRKEVLKIENKFSRPELKLIYTTITPIELNLSLPKDELIAYISKIKDMYDNKNFRTPLELLGEYLESSNEKINKSKVADMFFVYDYLTFKKELIEKDNEYKYKEYEEQVQEINESPYLSPIDRKIQLKELKKEFEENTNVRINELFNDIENFTPAKVKRYYYKIKPFIDECKYKELITGKKNIDYEDGKIYSYDIKEVNS